MKLFRLSGNHSSLALLLCGLGLLLVRPVLADLDEFNRLVQTGTPELALHLVEREQPDSAADLSEWLVWERQRIELMRNMGRWDGLIDRLDQFPDGLPAYVLQWAVGQRAEAFINKGAPETARNLIRRQLWSEDEKPMPVQAQWRRLIIQAYLAEGRSSDAYTAMLRYRQDYGEGDAQFRLLQAQVLLSVGRSETASRLLVGEEGYEARLVALQMRLRGSEQSMESLQSDATQLLEDGDFPTALRGRLQRLLAEVAHRIEDHPLWIASLERALVDSQRVNDATLSPEYLWDAYLKYGEILGNQSQLLRGDDNAWYDAARLRFEREPEAARALFATLAIQGMNSQQRELAHMQLGVSLAEAGMADTLLPLLYRPGMRFASEASIPAPIRHRLIEIALARGDLTQAGELLRDEFSPPAGQDQIDWQLLRARVLVLGGKSVEGAGVLQQLLATQEEWPPEGLDRLMQVVFDLQTVGRHDEALQLFDDLLKRDLPIKQRREICFWTADSHKAKASYVEAARWYLRSAAIENPFAMDPWAQTARFNAAGVLVKAGLYDDAAGLYRSLGSATKDPARRATLRRQIQEVNLLKRNQANLKTPAPVADEMQSDQPSEEAMPVPVIMKEAS